jgi:hypothetical protein
MSVEGRKDDQGKLPWHLLPPDALDQIVWVLQHGANKYGERNWENGMSWSRPFSALMRHMWAWWRGEGVDPETGISHLSHAGCCIMFLLAYEQRSIGSDDRPINKDALFAQAPVADRLKSDQLSEFQSRKYPALDALRRAASATELQSDPGGARGA